MNSDPPGVQVGFQRGRGTRDQTANICWIMEKAREFQKNVYFCFIDYTKAFVWITTNWKILREMGILDNLTCLLRNLYAGQEATVRTRYGTTDWFKTGKAVWQGCIFKLNIFKLNAEWNEVSQSYWTLCDPIDCSLPGSSVHGIFQARILEWVAISFSRGIFPTQVSRIVGRHFYHLNHQGSQQTEKFFKR